MQGNDGKNRRDQNGYPKFQLVSQPAPAGVEDLILGVRFQVSGVRKADYEILNTET